MKKTFLIILVIVWAIGTKYFIDHPHLRQKFLATVRPPALADMPRVLQEAAPVQTLPARVYPPVPGISAWEQAPVSSGACVSPPTLAVVPVPAKRIYRWTNANGESAFGDRPPVNVVATLYDPERPERPQYFTLNLEHIGRRQVPYIRAHLQSRTTSIYEILRELLGPERLRQVALNVKLFQSQEDYRAYAQEVAGPGTASAGGFYSLTTNQVATYQYPDDDRTLSVLQHEAVHVIVGGLLGGTTPLWLNEGMAEYFGNMTTGGQYALVSPDEKWLEIARHAVSSGYPRRLADLLVIDRDTWYGDARQTHYAIGWSLVYFLMDSPQGRRSLASLLQAKAGSYCTPVDQARWLARSYPGGAAAMQREFFAWVQDASPKEKHRF